MSTIERGKRIRMTFQQRGSTGRPTLLINVSADDDILPHEHTEDMRQIAAAVMGVPLKSLEGIEVELRRVGGEHPHPHPHPHPHEEEESGPAKAKA